MTPNRFPLRGGPSAVHFWLSTFAALSLAQVALGGSCKENKLCCPGRDSACVVQNAPLNSVMEDMNEKPCYCDHACLKLGDCCTDFKDACGGTESN
ncbi:hypothetical protein M8J76_004739 [Diaphorina citri]|nr:hypothetical protein M8J75_003427 [Diaphorina citri]KAI5722170.1 hypothetical protein M8J76_004739 [Diaphorina citri]